MFAAGFSSTTTTTMAKTTTCSDLKDLTPPSMGREKKVRLREWSGIRFSLLEIHLAVGDGLLADLAFVCVQLLRSRWDFSKQKLSGNDVLCWFCLRVCVRTPRDINSINQFNLDEMACFDSIFLSPLSKKLRNNLIVFLTRPLNPLWCFV